MENGIYHYLAAKKHFSDDFNNDNNKVVLQMTSRPPVLVHNISFLASSCTFSQTFEIGFTQPH